MSKLYIVISLMFLWFMVFGVPKSCAFGPTMYTGTGAGGAPTSPTCVTQTLDQSNSTTTGTVDIYDYITLGQSYTAGITGDIHRIVVKGTAYSGVNSTITGRWGTTSDLSSSYTATDSSALVAGTQEYELVFPEGSRPSQTASTTYYVNVANSSGSWGDRFSVQFDEAGDPYASGQYYYAPSVKWTATSYHSTWDLWFEIYVCD